MKKLNELTEEEIENLGYDELAYKILEETNKKMKITDLFRQVCDLKGLSEADYENLIGDFFEILTTDKKFIMLENGFWDLKSRHSEKLVVEEDDDFDWTEELHKEEAGEEHIQHVIRAILKQAIIEDIHELNFEQVEEGLKVVFKKNGEPFDKGTVPAILNSAFVSKLKTLSNLDATVCEIPQLGKLCFKVENTMLIASVSSFPTIMGERISLKIYKPPIKLDKIITDEKQRSIITHALNNPGIILVCGSPLSGKTHLIYSLLMEAAKVQKNIMTIESIAKYELKGVNQCELNENIGFNMDKALRYVEFQSPDTIYLEGVKTRDAFEFLSELFYSDKTVITEFMANNMTDLRQKLAFEDFQSFKTLISCLIFIHSRDSVEVFDKETLQKYLA